MFYAFIVIGLIIIILGLSSRRSLTNKDQDQNKNDYQSLIDKMPTYTGKIEGSPPDGNGNGNGDDLGTHFWDLFQNPNIWINSYTIKEVPQNIYFKSNTKLNTH
jgi:hypothetical protein